MKKKNKKIEMGIISLAFLVGMILVSTRMKGRNEEMSVKSSYSLMRCVDGDTAWFLNENKEEVDVRFLAIDAPESTNQIDPYGKVASEYTCSVLNHAKEITLEMDMEAQELDKYGRTLAWVFVDGVLLQKQLVLKGLAEVKYLYGDYKYTEELEKAQQIAQENHLGIWKD